MHRGLSVFDKVFTERAELLWQYIIALHAVTDDISSFHRKAKIASITGGTTTAVGGVAAIAGLALIPVTFGASLLLTAVGVGVVAAGGITSASASISDNVNNMHDRKKVGVRVPLQTHSFAVLVLVVFKLIGTDPNPVQRFKERRVGQAAPFNNKYQTICLIT